MGSSEGLIIVDLTLDIILLKQLIMEQLIGSGNYSWLKVASVWSKMLRYLFIKCIPIFLKTLNYQKLKNSLIFNSLFLKPLKNKSLRNSFKMPRKELRISGVEK